MLAKTNTQRLLALRKYTGHDIVDVQIHDVNKNPFVFLFEPSFWWFKKRYRMSLSEFENVLTSIHLSHEEVIFCDSLDTIGLK